MKNVILADARITAYEVVASIVGSNNGTLGHNYYTSCTGLTSAPALPATTLASRCYSHMFSNCTQLCSVTCLATEDIGNNNSLENWLTRVASSGTFYKAKGTTWPNGAPNNNVSGIPSGWTVVDYVAP